MPADGPSIERFIDANRSPTLIHLTKANYKSILESRERAVIVLAALHGGEEGEKEKKEFAKVSRAWKRGGRTFIQPVWFVTVKGEEWSRWLRQRFGVGKASLPAVVVVDTSVSLSFSALLLGTNCLDPRLVVAESSSLLASSLESRLIAEKRILRHDDRREQRKLLRPGHILSPRRCISAFPETKAYRIGN